MNSTTENRPPLPPFSLEQATKKVRMAEDAWNTRQPETIAMAYTENSRWRNRDVFLEGRQAIIKFLAEKWQREKDYRLIKELWAHDANRIAVRFAYEWRDVNNQWCRAYGNENWQFSAAGLMELRYASINDLVITEDQRLFHWPLGRRPGDHPGLDELGL